MTIEWKVIRDEFTENATIGRLYADGVFLAYTCEDRIRGPGKKVPAKTAIPAGRYKVIIDVSNRFTAAARARDPRAPEVRMPHVLDVPMFAGIRIHSGNVPGDTEGCLLVGTTRGHDRVDDSRTAYKVVFAQLEEHLAKGEVWITYENKNPPAALLAA